MVAGVLTAAELQFFVICHLSFSVLRSSNDLLRQLFP